MKRREFVFGSATTFGCMASAWPVMGQAQQGKIWRMGVLIPGFLTGPTGDLLDVLRLRLVDLGYIEGKNLIVDARAAEGRNDRLQGLANELVAFDPDVIVAVGTPAIAAAKGATSTIPIVMTPATDPVASGFVKTLAHPGGNITGVANMFGDTTAKTLEVLLTILPSAKKIAVLMSSNPTHPGLFEVSKAAAEVLRLSTVPIVAATPADLDRAFQDNRSASSCHLPCSSALTR